MKIPLYYFKPVEEIARGVAAAVFGYLIGAAISGQIQPTRASVTAALLGALPIAWAALRTALNKTSLTPPETSAS